MIFMLIWCESIGKHLYVSIVSSLRGDSPIQKANILPGPTHEAAVVLALDLNSDWLRAQWKCGFYWYESNLQMYESNPQMNPFSSQRVRFIHIPQNYDLCAGWLWEEGPNTSIHCFHFLPSKNQESLTFIINTSIPVDISKGCWCQHDRLVQRMSNFFGGNFPYFLRNLPP